MCCKQRQHRPLPEYEQSPGKDISNSVESLAHDMDTLQPNYLCFDISSNASDLDSVHDDVTAIIEKLQDQVQVLRSQRNSERNSPISVLAKPGGAHDAFFTLITESLGHRLAASTTEAKTSLSRTLFTEKFNDMHKTGLWNRLCDKYCGGTRDPIEKSNAFLNLTFRIHLLWNG